MIYQTMTKLENQGCHICLPYQELFHLLIENVPAAIAILDARMCYLKVSQRWLKDYGSNDEDIIGKSHCQIYGGLPEHWQEIYKRCQTGVVETWEEVLPKQESYITYKIKWEARPLYLKNYADPQAYCSEDAPIKDEIGGLILFAEKVVFDRSSNIKNCDFEAKFVVSSEDKNLTLIPNITDCKEAEIALRQSEERLQAVITNTPIVLYALDTNGVFTLSEGKGLESIGKKPGEVIGQSVFELYRENTDILAEINRVLAGTEGSWTADFDNVIYENRAAPMRDQNGEIIGIIGTAIDVTHRVQAEYQLTQLLQREKLLNRLTNQIRNTLDFNTIIETAIDEIHQFLQISRCQFVWYYHERSEPYWEVVKEACNPGNPDLRGRYEANKIGSLPGKLLDLEILRIEDLENVSDPVWQQLVSTFGFTSLLAIPMQSRNGAIGVINCIHTGQARPWIDSEVELLLAVMDQLAIAVNQAELYAQAKEKAEELERSLHKLKTTQAQLIQTEKISNLGQLVAGIAHEVNNPVAFICGNLHIAKHYSFDLLKHLQLYRAAYPNPTAEIKAHAEEMDLEFTIEDLPKMLSSMVLGTDRIREIMESLRNFSRVDRSEAKPVNIHEGLDSTLTILQHRLKKQSKRPAIQVIKEYGDLPLVECYSGQMNQVFMNILANAIDAIDEYNSGRTYAEIELNPNIIRIRTELVDHLHVAIRIKDNGPGIPETVLSRLFDSFFTTKPVGKGTGLGLSISYKIVTEIHKGQIECISAPGKGTEFAIEIPIEQKLSIKECPAS
ncbi:ATP-binding protein [Argonema antarcticum]|uniref:ATP-binding protein n=1 Tax=Argonema antarcticum TaxID=2942763 RepID=UPI00201347FE|nr:ATP-binding protein [Argonema antarcticum]MCL1472109.1 PAS domain S-box protein [Argonema antarcticum A004/B2]